MGQRKVSYTQRILESSYVREENIDIDILVTSRNSDWKVTVYQNNKQTSLKNKEVEPIEPVQMNIYQSSTCVKDLGWLHLDSEPRVQEKQQVKDQQS